MQESTAYVIHIFAFLEGAKKIGIAAVMFLGLRLFQTLKIFIDLSLCTYDFEWNKKHYLWIMLAMFTIMFEEAKIESN